MKLQLLSTDLSQSSHTTTNQLFQNLPLACNEISSINKEIIYTQTLLKQLSIQLTNTNTTNTLNFLYHIDLIKQRILSVNNTLNEIQNWAKKKETIENVFQSRDLLKVKKISKI
jgi:hypothetical protein